MAVAVHMCSCLFAFFSCPHMCLLLFPTQGSTMKRHQQILPNVTSPVQTTSPDRFKTLQVLSTLIRPVKCTIRLAKCQMFKDMPHAKATNPGNAISFAISDMATVRYVDTECVQSSSKSISVHSVTSSTEPKTLNAKAAVSTK